MPIIGNRKDAETALSLHRSSSWGSDAGGKDWTRIGSGSFRDCWLHKPTGVVYKIESNSYGGYTNASELRNARALKRESFMHVRIPKVSGFKIDRELVLAMEHVKGPLGSEVSTTEKPEARKELHEKCRFEDMHGANFIFDEDGYIVPIDMGSTRRKSKEFADSRVLTCGGGSVW